MRRRSARGVAPGDLPWKGKLAGRVALVTGSSRGVGKGIALALGETGATVYVTGRTVRGKPHARGLSGSVQDTAEEVSSRGGVGIPVRCDHTRDGEVRQLVSRIQRREGRLDILVNNAFGGEDGSRSITSYDDFPFWKHDFEEWWYRMFTAYLRSTFVTTFHAIPLMIRRPGGLIVNTLWWNRDRYLYDLFFDVASAGVGRMAYGLGLELRAKRLTVLGVSPGWTRTEAMSHLPAKILGGLASPEYVGRAVVHLALDPGVKSKSGRVFEVGALAKEYGFVDVDGRSIDYHQEISRRRPAGWPPN
jgi:NAD(P)-dependent dehydrogenase (short-subunit alcohol dehydrogenase family)